MAECLVYTAEEVATMLGCKISTAYNKIKGMNKDYANKKGISVATLISGKINKNIFHEYYPDLKNN